MSMKSLFFLLQFSVNALMKQRTMGLRLSKNSQFLFSFLVFILKDEENTRTDGKICFFRCFLCTFDDDTRK